MTLAVGGMLHTNPQKNEPTQIVQFTEFCVCA